MSHVAFFENKKFQLLLLTLLLLLLLPLDCCSCCFLLGIVSTKVNNNKKILFFGLSTSSWDFLALCVSIRYVTAGWMHTIYTEIQHNNLPFFLFFFFFFFGCQVPA